MQFRMFALLLTLAAPLAAAADETGKYSSKDGKYSIEFPGKPIERTQDVNTPAGTLKIQMAMSVVGTDTVYIVSHNTVPAEAAKAVDQLLEGAMKGATQRFGKVAKQSKITIGKNKSPGLEAEFEEKDGKTARTRVYLVGDVMYQVMIMGKSDLVKSAAATKYFDSFKLTE